MWERAFTEPLLSHWWLYLIPFLLISFVTSVVTSSFYVQIIIHLHVCDTVLHIDLLINGNLICVHSTTSLCSFRFRNDVELHDVAIIHSILSFIMEESLFFRRFYRGKRADVICTQLALFLFMRGALSSLPPYAIRAIFNRRIYEQINVNRLRKSNWCSFI